MPTMMDLELWREHRARIHREVENERLARRLRTNGRREKAHGLWKRAIRRVWPSGEASLTRES